MHLGEGRPRAPGAVLGRGFTRALTVVGLLGPLVALVAPGGNAGADIGSDRAKIHQIEAKINAAGDRVQNLVGQYNSVQRRLFSIQAQIASDKARLAAEERAERQASLRLRTSAVAAYVIAASGTSSTLATLTGADATKIPEQQVYLGVAGASLQNAMTTLQIAHERTTRTAASLQQEQAATLAILRPLAAARGAAEAGIAADQAILSKVNAQVLQLVTAQRQAREAAQEAAEERSIAATTAQQSAITPPPAAPVAVTPTAGSYANPLRGLRGVRSDRIDQGVDFAGFGPIFAIGNGVVLSTVVGGWPGGTFISYRLLDGPANGLVVYAAEDISPQVQIGQHVSSSTVLGQVYEGSTGIEIGWADGTGQGTTMASDHGQYYGGNSTAFGANFSQLLASLGGPGGVLQNNPPTGSLPPGWPHW